MVEEAARLAAKKAAGRGSSPTFGSLLGPIRRLLRGLRGEAPSTSAPATPDNDPRNVGVTPGLRAFYHDIAEEPFWEIAQKCLPHTLVLIERLYNIYKTMEYLTQHRIEGDIVECGVLRGGSVMCAAESLAHFQSTERRIYLYDSFEGASPPGAADVDCHGVAWSEQDPSVLYWPNASLLPVVKKNLSLTRYPQDRFVFVKGLVQETLPHVLPEKIAFLRLDTDFYDPTKLELEHLLPRLVKGGVLTIDDYGHFLGARKAVDEHWAKGLDRIMLHRIDYTARTGVKA